METEQFFLKWHNFENNLSSGFADLLQKESMVDVTLAAEGRIVHAHKIILSICSSYFRSMFQVNPCQHPIVVLKDVGYQELTDMLDFMYKGEANVRQQDLPSFLKLAETLKVKGLAGGQADPDENLKRRSSQCLSSNLSHSTKDSLANEKEESSNDLIENVILRKKRKRSSSPFKILDPKNIPHSQNIKVEEKEEGECDHNSMKNKDMTAGQNVIMKEERLSDNSLDSYGENHLLNEVLEDGKDAGPSTLEENCEATPQASTFQFDPKRVPIWSFYTVNYDYDIAKCKVCRRIIKTRRKDGTTNVWSHMRNVHPHQYKLALRLKEQWKCMKRRKYHNFLTHLS